MKIGIFTLPLTSRNYGGILQAYALTTYLRREFEAEVELIDRRFPPSLKYNFAREVYRIFKPGFFKTLDFFYLPIDKFVNENIIKSPSFYNHSSTLNYLKSLNFSCIITGSDQVFRTLYSKQIYRELFLGFDISNIKKASYAGSFGTDIWEDQKLKGEVKSLLNDFNQISVREDKGVDILKAEFGLDGEQHIDPVFLLESVEYFKLIGNSDKLRATIKNGYVAAYVLDRNPTKNKIIEDTATSLNLKYDRFGEKPVINRNNYAKYYGKQADSVYDWLNILYNSDFVIADSFHGIAFSILFNKQFIAIGNSSRGLSRFTSILKLFGLEDRLVLLGSDDIEVENIVQNKIDYTPINRIIDVQRKRSLDYFTKLMC